MPHELTCASFGKIDKLIEGSKRPNRQPVRKARV